MLQLLLFFESFPGHAKGALSGPHCGITLAIDERGDPVSASHTIDILHPRHSILFNPRSGLYEEAIACLHPELLALTFLNCRKTELVQRTAERKMSRAHNKKHGRPLVSYKTIEVSAIRKIFDTEAGEGASIQKALHICRGHFKNYREHGLFGRNKGLYWWGPQIRGSKEAGVVINDYRVACPQSRQEAVGQSEPAP